jgi:hypothetical protein
VDTTSGSPVASLTVSVNGGSESGFKTKGVCYSPCPLNGSNGYAPTIGDWFWDSYSGKGYDSTGWGELWARDLPNIRALGANTVRVYSMLSRHLNSDGTYPDPWNSSTLMTHTSFLDQCWNGGVNPIYVLIGIPLPQAMFWQNIYNGTPQVEIDFWTNVLKETVTQVAAHPAVLGFIIQNELDSNVVTYGSNTAYVTFWWDQVRLMANTAKIALGTNQKLIGMAVHDDPNIVGQAANYMATCTSIDFWGVNTYQTQNFDPVFDQVIYIGPGYAGLTGAALKPVILTEWGMPATSHENPCDPSTIYADTTTIGKVASVISPVVPLAYSQQLCLGLYYFEYSDEWWNQDGSPNIYTWFGGSAASGFPNGYWDQEGFGLYSIARGSGLHNNSPIWSQNDGHGGPTIPIDIMTPRTGTISALTNVFNSMMGFQE